MSILSRIQNRVRGFFHKGTTPASASVSAATPPSSFTPSPSTPTATKDKYTSEQKDALVRKAVQQFPQKFALKSHPDDIFSINEEDSYYRPRVGVWLMLDGQNDYLQMTPAELKKDIIAKTKTKKPSKKAKKRR